VTLSGLLDFAGANVGGTQNIAKGSTVSTNIGTSATSVIRIDAVEDLGGGMKASVRYALDPRTFANDNLVVTNNTGASGASTTAAAPAYTAGATGSLANTTTGMARDEAYISLSGGFGDVKLGSPNSIGLTSFLGASPLGTGVGSGYGLAGTFSNIRYNRSVRYDTPDMAGFSASVLYAPGNDQATVAPLLLTSGSSTALTIPNARKTTEIGLRYANGPLTVSYVNISQAAQTNKTGWYSGAYSNAAAPADEPAKTSANIINASYNFGSTTLYAGWNDGDRLAPVFATDGAAVKSKGYRVAIKQNIGAIDLMAQYTEQKSLTPIAQAANAGEVTAKVTGLRADYNLSKTAAVYVGYESWDTGAAYTTTFASASGKRNITSLGLRKSF
jgi:predicted porin